MNETIQKKQEAEKKLLLEQFLKMPIIQVACEKTNIGRSTYYRWRKEDEQFCKDADEALRLGEELVNDLSESQLISLIKDKNFPAIHLWLRQHHPKYGNKINIEATVRSVDPMTPEQLELTSRFIDISQQDNDEKA